MPDLPNNPAAQAADVLAAIRARHPLVHCLTNGVVKNFTANALLALGAAPAMVEHPEEAALFAGFADALLINPGTLATWEVAPIEAAAPAAAKADKPWVLDPVAVGPLPVRTRLARALLEHKPTLIRGNASEIIALAGQEGKGRGVDSGDAAEAAIEAARSLARRTGGAVLVTGPVDYATDGGDAIGIANGHILLTRVTGVGCAQGAVAAACAAVAPSPLIAAVAAALIMGIAGDVAAEHAASPGSFAVALLDALDMMAPDTLTMRARIQ